MIKLKKWIDVPLTAVTVLEGAILVMLEDIRSLGGFVLLIAIVLSFITNVMILKKYGRVWRRLLNENY